MERNNIGNPSTLELYNSHYSAGDKDGIGEAIEELRIIEKLKGQGHSVLMERAKEVK